MAALLWGNVYYKETFAGVLRQEPGNRSSFAYDSSYLSSDNPAIAQTLPLRVKPFIFEVELPPFFDNLVAEGWLELAQVRLLGKRQASRFELLLTFGEDCAGAVSIKDPSPNKISKSLALDDPKEHALLTGRASLSGVQPKIVVTQKNGVFQPAVVGALSTHIAKFPSQNHDDLVVNEYLTTMAMNELLPDDPCVEMCLGNIDGIKEEALIITRFDRANGGRIHFEEFNQLLGLDSYAKYNGAYKDMADFVDNTPGCLPIEKYRLYLRILAGILLGNTDMHFKNFAMFHTDAGLRLTPSYDQVAAVIYGYTQLALKIRGSENLILNNLKPGNIIALAKDFGLEPNVIIMAIDSLGKNIAAAKNSVLDSKIGSKIIKDKIVELMEKRWNGTFASIGQALLKKQ